SGVSRTRTVHVSSTTYVTGSARAAPNPFALARAVGLAVREVDPDQSIFDAASMPRRIRNTIWQLELARGAFRLFALLAFALAAVGVYGLLSQSVASRHREIAVRMATGASPGRVLAGILGEALALAAAGGAVGFGIGLCIHSLLAAMLPQLPDRTVGADLGLLGSALGLAILSSAAPAARALRIAPASALRGE
ncbi:MAG TPA: FtsX-like permease family protein, partial [Thermoanaerobaculia bacterium]|nr:FtsX-like permease family protein [Thermoanaerobaculia bacterium]